MGGVQGINNPIRSVDMRRPHKHGCVGAPSHTEITAAARRSALNAYSYPEKEERGLDAFPGAPSWLVYPWESPFAPFLKSTSSLVCGFRGFRVLEPGL